MREWHIITCEYPPRVGGVSDYTFSLASSLGAANPVHVWCPSAIGPPPEASGVVVHPDLNRFSPSDLKRVGALLNRRPGPRHLFVQWVPQGFGYRSVNVWFAVWLACRTWVRHDDLHLMVHEPFLSFSPHPLRMGAALLHRLMLAIAGSGASQIWLSTAAWKSRVRPYVPARAPIQWLPVPAARLFTTAAAKTGRPSRTPSVAKQHDLVGHFGTHSSLVTRELAPALDVILERSTANVILIGRNSDTFRRTFLETRPHAAARVRATGVVSSGTATEHLLACDMMIQPYPDGLTARRSSTLTLLALGLPVVTNVGPLTETFWSGCGAVELADAPDGSRIGEAALRLLHDRAGRMAIASRARAMYDESFDSRHATAMLQAAAWPLADAHLAIHSERQSSP